VGNAWKKSCWLKEARKPSVDKSRPVKDAQRMRQLSLRSLRAHAYDLLHFARWFENSSDHWADLTQSTLLDYFRHQLEQPPQPKPQTINHRLVVVRCLYHFH
jgi:site-specific recombinase XerD